MSGDTLLPRVVVVILNWNGRDDTIACVDSVLADGIPPHDVVVVDNGSSDDSAHSIASAFPTVTLVRNAGNLGFTGGMNTGLTRCLALDPAYVCVMNNDTLVTDGMFRALVGAIDPLTAVSPEVRYRDRPEIVWFGGGVVERRECWPRHLTPAELAITDADNEGGRLRHSETLAGCCILASADVWRRVGLFDERFFLLFEDADWSARARAAGVTLLVARNAVLLHGVSASFGGPGRLLASFYYARNGLYFGFRHCRGERYSRMRFLRDHVVRPAGRTVRAGSTGEGLAVALFAGIGVTCFLIRAYGRAPSWVERMARWLTSGPCTVTRTDNEAAV